LFEENSLQQICSDVFSSCVVCVVLERTEVNLKVQCLLLPNSAQAVKTIFYINCRFTCISYSKLIFAIPIVLCILSG